MSGGDYWVHNLSPFLIEFSEGVGIRYYGLAYLAAFVVAFLLLDFYHKKGRSPLDREALSNSFYAIIAGVLIGGRLGIFIFYDFGALMRDPIALFRVWEGGMASHGGFMGVAVAIWWISRKEKVSIYRVSDLIVSVATPGLFFGRLANFINGELVGKISMVPWAVRFPESMPVGTPIEEIMPRHPSQLYEAGLEGLFLFLYLQHRFWRNSLTERRPGALTGEFFIGYAIARIFCEQFREPDAALIAGLSRGSFYSLFLIVSGIVLIVVSYRRRGGEEQVPVEKKGRSGKKGRPKA